MNAWLALSWTPRTETYRPLIDLKDLCKNLRQVGDAQLTSAATRIESRLKRGGQLVLEHKLDEDLEDSTVLVFLPRASRLRPISKDEINGSDYKRARARESKEQCLGSACVYGAA